MISTKQWYTVCGVYTDSMQPYTVVVAAESTEDATRTALIKCDEDNGYACTLLVVAVFEGRLQNKLT